MKPFSTLNSRLRFALMIILLAFFINCSLAAYADQTESPREKTVRVGAYINPPKMYTNADNEIVGLFPDILNEIAEKENWDIVYIWGSWDQCLERLEDGSVDIMPDVAFSEERAERYSFSDETVLINWGVVYSRSDNPITTILDLDKKNVAVMARSIHTKGKNSIQSLAEKFDIDCRFIEVEDYQQVLEKIETRQADAGVVNRLFGSLHQEKYGVIDSPVVFNPRHLKFAFPKKGKLTSELKKKIDRHLRAFKKDSFSDYYTIIKAYLSGTTKPWLITKSFGKAATITMTEEEKKWVAEHKNIRLGFDPEFVPFEYRTKKGQYQGIASEFVRLVGERIGVNFIPETGLSWVESVDKAKRKEIDVLPCVGMTEARKEFLSYSRSYLAFSRVVITRTDSNVKSFDELDSLTVSVQENTSHFGYIKENTTIEPVTFPTFEEAIKSVARRETDAVVANLTVATHFIRELGLSNLKIAAFASDKTTPLYFAVRKDWEILTGLVNRALQSITPSERAKIQQRWLHVEINKKDDRLFKTLLTKSEVEWIQNHPVIRTGVDAGYAPYSFIDNENRFDGLSLDILERIAEISGLEFHTVPDLKWPQIIDGARNRKIDLILTCVKTRERESFLDFTDIYIPTPLAIMTRNDFDGITKSSDLSGKRVALVKGYSSSQKVIEEYPDVVPVFVDNPLEGLSAVSSKKADAYVGVLGISLFHTYQNGLTNLQVATNYDEKKNGQRLAVRKDWPILRSILSKALLAIPLEEKSKIFQKWLPIQPSGKSLHFKTLLSPREKDWLKAHPLIRVCSDPDYAPVEFKTDEGVFSGIAIDYLALLEEHLGVKFEVENIEQWHSGVDMVKTGRLDMISCIMATSERKKTFLFTDPYLDIPIVIFTRDDTSYVGSLNELSKKKLIVVKGYATRDLIAQDYPLIEIVEASNTEEALIMLDDGEADAYAESILSAGYYLKKLKLTSLKVAGKTPYTSKLSMAVRDDFNVLAGILQKFFNFLPESEKNRIYRKWISIKYEHETDFTTLLKVVLPILLVLLLFMYWVKRLRVEINYRQEVEQKLFVAKKQADSANRAKSAFLANMSHEIRTPMNAILGYSQLLNRDPDLTHEQKESLGTINSSGEHLLSLINDILEISKIEAGKFELVPKVFDFYEFLNTLYLMFKGKTSEKGLAFDLVKSDNLVQYIKTDEGKLKQILINLLGNAVKFTDKGSVTLRVGIEKLKPDDSESFYIVIDVEDTGRGIAKENIKKIFQSFEKLGEESAIEGTGLGLAISKKYAKLMKGDIRVRSIVGKGSLFQVKCSVEQGSREDMDTKVPHRDVFRLKDGQKKIKTLIADDKETNRLLLKKMLSRVGFETREVVNGAEAVKAWKTWRPEIILMDLVMPVLNGMDAIKSIRSQPGGDEPVIIAVTASVMKEEREQVMAGGANEFLGKPFIEAELFHLIAKNSTIKFIYDKEKKKEVVKLPEVDQYRNIELLPQELRDRLVEALNIGYTREINKCIEQVSQYDPALFPELKRMAEGYDYQAILGLFQSK